MPKPQIIGISGAFGSGKSTAADYLLKKGYTKISLVQFLEDALKFSGEKEITRRKLQDLGNSWREMYGRGVLGKKTVEYIEQKKLNKVVVEGFRNIGEIEELKNAGDFTLIALLVNRDIRLKRLVKLKRREKLTKELFERLDYRDMGIGEKTTGLQVAVCIAIADVFLENNKTQEDLFKKLDNILKEFK
jgi:dephospho-CoA kinase